MADTFEYDVFLSHNSNDKPKVRRLAERLRAAGLRVWFDEWAIQPGDDIFLAIERGLEISRTLILCISQDALDSGWVATERSTALFRDPTNKRRRFIPLLLSDCQLPDTLRRYKYVSYQQESDASFAKLLAACRSSEDSSAASPETTEMAAGPAREAPPPKPFDLSGHWIASLCKDGGQPVNVYLTFEVMDDLFFGSVSYPTGNAGILDGKIAGNTISFMTRHVPNWSEQEATIKWVAKIVGDELRGITQDPGGQGRFTAQRSAEGGRYGWVPSSGT